MFRNSSIWPLNYGFTNYTRRAEYVKDILKSNS